MHGDCFIREFQSISEEGYKNPTKKHNLNLYIEMITNLHQVFPLVVLFSVPVVFP